MSSSSVIFQPLLHDPLGWKPSNSTYVDHYKWKKYRTTIKDKKISTYGQQYQRQFQKQQANQSLPLTTNIEQTIHHVILVKKNEDQQQPPPSTTATPISYRYSPSKTPIYIVECNQRPVSANENSTCNSKASQRPPTAPAEIQEKTRPLTVLDTRQSSPKEKSLIETNNDNSRHWLTYPNPKTPQYILDIKQRLGQLKIPSTLARPSSATTQKQTPQLIMDRPSSASVQHQQKQSTNNDQHNFLTYNTRETPDELRATRYRIDKHRYNPSLDSYPPRPQTCPVRRTGNLKLTTPLDESVTTEQLPTNDAWTVDEERKSVVPDHESSSILIQMVDCDGLPNEYVDALETANIAQEEYEKSLKMNPERKPDNYAYRRPETQNDSYIAYENQQPSTNMNNQLRQVARSTQNEFGVWVRNATDKERASAMKILHDVLNQPIAGYENQIRSKSVFKQAPAPPPVRATSATRKLGRTRTQHKFPCEICEKLLIKRHVWDLTGSETLNCPHHPQGIQVKSS